MSSFWKNKNLIRFLCILLAAVSIGGLFWEKTNSGAELKNNQHTGFILPGNVISQEFQYTAGMDKVGVNIATFARKNNCKVILELKKKENGETVVKQEFDAASFLDNNFVFLKTPTLSPGTWLSFEISSPDSNHRNAVTVWHIPTSGKFPPIKINGKEHKGREMYLRFQISPLPRFFTAAGITFLILMLLWGLELLTTKKKEPSVNGTPVNPKPKKEFDWGMHYFRAFAIICIILDHYVFWIDHRLATGLLISSSIYFVFISGYLSQMIGIRNSALNYYQKKIQNVIIPYIIVSFLSLGIVYFCGTRVALCESFTHLEELTNILLMGKAQSVFWYIPFITGIFIITPLLLCCGKNTFFSLFVISAGAFFLIGKRANFDCSPIEFLTNYAYFSSSYLFGMAYFRYKESFDHFFRSTWPAFLIIVAVCFLGIYFPKTIGQKFLSIQITAGIQKLAFIPIVILLLNLIRDKKILILDLFAKYSFTLYFSQMIFLFYFLKARNTLYQLFGTEKSYLIFTVLLIAWMLIMLFSSIVWKKACGKYSRMLIGS